MKNAQTGQKTVGVLLTRSQYAALQRIAHERGINRPSTLARSVLVETLHLPTGLQEEEPTSPNEHTQGR